MVVAAQAIFRLSSVTETVVVAALTRAAITLALLIWLELCEDLLLSTATGL